MGLRRLLSKGITIVRTEGLRTFVTKTESFLRRDVRERWHKLQERYWRVRYGAAAPFSTELIHVDPSEIERMATGHRPFSSKRTAIVDGDWDRNQIDREFSSERELREHVDTAGVARLEQYAFFRAVTDHFENGTPWDETEFYQYKRQSGEKGHYGSEEKLQRRFAEMDRLYESMQVDGYKSQQEIQNDNPEDVPLSKRVKSPPEHGEVAVAIARDGEILHVDGRHRLGVAQVSGVSEIPVRVVARHTEWQQLRARIAAADDSETVLASIAVSSDHPDLLKFTN